MPRPEWAGPGDDTLALGGVLDWAAEFDDPRQRALLEAALAASGLLGASLVDAGAATRNWRVEAIGPAVENNLGETLVVDPAHPLASMASAVGPRLSGGQCVHGIATN